MKVISKDDKDTIHLSPTDLLLRDQRDSSQFLLQNLTHFYCHGHAVLLCSPHALLLFLVMSCMELKQRAKRKLRKGGHERQKSFLLYMNE